MNASLLTNAMTTESILSWSYSISDSCGYRSPDMYPETRGRVETRMEDLRVDAALVQSVVNKELKHSDWRSIIEAKYGERKEAIYQCAVTLNRTTRTQSIDGLVRIVEEYCAFRRYKDAEAMKDFRMGSSKTRETKGRYLGILEGWHWFAISVLEESFRERGWVE